MRSSLLKLDFWQEYCKDIFGESITNRADETNIEYGSTELRANNIFFTNGGEDPWQWAGVLKSHPKLNNISKLLQCENCAHCVDLYNESEADSEILQEAREHIKNWVRLIIDGPFE